MKEKTAGSLLRYQTRPKWVTFALAKSTKDGKVYVGSKVVRNLPSSGRRVPGHAILEKEVSVIENSRARTVLKTKDVPSAQIIGITSEGQFLGWDELHLEGTRERFPLVFVAGEVLQ